MVNDAKKYENDDKKTRERVDARNGLENYAYSMKNTINDEKVASKLDATDKQTVKDAIDEALRWLENNQEAGKEEYEDHQKELEGKCSPIFTKMYQQGGGEGGAPAGGMPGIGGMGGGSSGGSSGPKVEEVD